MCRANQLIGSKVFSDDWQIYNIIVNICGFLTTTYRSCGARTRGAVVSSTPSSRYLWSGHRPIWPEQSSCKIQTFGHSARESYLRS